jgi:branched-subunit amino acid aminotransferase/4-amino-4-deoxychorismate lyase
VRPLQDPTEVVVLDGQLLPSEGPVLPAGWPGVLRGEGIFEAFRVDAGEPSPLIERHAARLAHSARLCEFDLGERGLLESLPEILPHLAPSISWRLRFTVLRRPDGRLARLWTVGRAPSPLASMVLAMGDARVDPHCPIAGAKTNSRMSYQLARHRARAAGADEAILRTIHGDLAEGTATNLLLVLGGAVHTPGLDRGILAGVTRGAILAGCRDTGIPVFERELEVGDLAAADEIYVTSAVIGVVPATRIIGIRDDLPGPAGAMLTEVRSAYQAGRERSAATRRTLT